MPAKPVDAGVVLRMDKPWEGAFTGYVTVIHDSPLYRLYYRGKPGATADGGADETTCYAESRDGIHWNKPDLGLYEVNGSRHNNVVLAGMSPFAHNLTPFLDASPAVSAAERYKAVAGVTSTGLHAFVSADGILWRKSGDSAIISTPPGAEAFDSQNVVFWAQPERRYVCYFRSWKKIGGVNYRWVSRTASTDFRNWSTPEEMTYGDTPPEHLYTNQTGPYFRAPHTYVGISARFEPGRQVLTEEQAKTLHVSPSYFKDCSDAVLITSRGGNRYDRTFMEAFLRPGLGLENWVSRSNYPALNLVPTSENEMSFYVTQNYAQPTNCLRRYSLRTDGFASIHASYTGGEMITRPFRFRGSVLEINYSTSAAGGVRVELQDAGGAALEGYRLSDTREILGDEIARTVEWKGGSDVSSLAGRVVRLRFVLKDADLYAFRFRD